VRGDHELNSVKAEKHPRVARPLRMATEDEIRAAVGAGPGSLGPKDCRSRCIVDYAPPPSPRLQRRRQSVTASIWFGVNWGATSAAAGGGRSAQRGARATRARTAGAGCTIARGIEVGHIFQLGTKYSEAMKAQVLDESGQGR
jgi:prolyl-tRNA synthetase